MENELGTYIADECAEVTLIFEPELFRCCPDRHPAGNAVRITDHTENALEGL